MSTPPPTPPARLSLLEMRDTLRTLGFPSVLGLDLASNYAATAERESRGDPNIVTAEKDPRTGELLGYSYGAFQIFGGRGGNPSLGQTVAQIVALELPPAESFRRQVDAIGGMFASTVQEAIAVGAVLERRGFPITDRTLSVLIDAVWQHGAPEMHRWATSTPTGDPAERHARTPEFLADLGALGVPFAFQRTTTLSLVALGVAIALLWWAWQRGWL